MSLLLLYSDGACRGNPALVLGGMGQSSTGDVLSASGVDVPTTNNRINCALNVKVFNEAL